MRRRQFYIDEDPDDRLQVDAARYGDPERLEEDPLSALVGAVDAEPADADGMVYGR